MEITIQEPCSEDWSNMSATQQGAFCQQCAKEVIDFTGKSSLEIKQTLALKVASKTSICGRIENRQLKEVNQEFIEWRSVQEEVNAVWMISLIAVFGLTLFSCSNTLSKEMVNQVQLVTTELSENDSLINAELSAEKQPSSDTNKLESVTNVVFPWNERPIVYMGAVSIIEPHIITTVSICEFVLGDIVLSGSIYVPENLHEELFEKYANPFAHSLPQSQETGDYSVSPLTSGLHNSITGVLGDGKDFQVELAPNPVDATSKLFVEIYKECEISILIKESHSKKQVFLAKGSVLIGEYALRLNFDELITGNYVLFVSSENQDERIEFGV